MHVFICIVVDEDVLCIISPSYNQRQLPEMGCDREERREGGEHSVAILCAFKTSNVLYLLISTSKIIMTES